MNEAALADLPEDILAIILCLVAKNCFGQEDGFRRWCKLAGALPCLSSFVLPRVPLKQLIQRNLPWEGEYGRTLCRANKTKQWYGSFKLLKLSDP